MLKLNKNYQLFYDHQFLYIYEQDSKKICFKVELDHQFNLIEFQHLMMYFHSLHEISTSPYRDLYLSIYKKDPSIFDIEKSEQKSVLLRDIELTVNQELFFLTYEYNPDEKINLKNIHFWGESRISSILTPLFETIYANIIFHEGVEDLNDESFINEEMHLVYGNAFTDEELNRIITTLQTHQCSVFHYRMNIDALIIGPLIVGDSSCSYSDITENLNCTVGDITTALSMVGSGLIYRISLFCMMDSLGYLGDDAQLPINAYFEIDRFTFNACTKRMIKQVNRLREYIQSDS